MRRKQILLVASIGAACLVVAAGVLFALNMQASAPGAAKDQTNTESTNTTQTPEPKPSFDKKQLSTTDPASPWIVVNKQHPLEPKSYAPNDLTSVGNGQRMRAEAAKALQQMFADASAAGFTLVADSGYRSYNTQVSVYNGYVKQVGQTETDKVSARPGYSEHQTGWAVDVGTGSCHLEDCFGDTPGGQWAAANAYKYGFMLRYPDTLTAITGYSHEAWHFRYVGVELATEMHNKNVQTLEQFFDITGGTTYKN